MRRLALVPLLVVLVLAGCAAGAAETAPTPTPTPTVAAITSFEDANTIDELTTYVLDQAPGTMTTNEVLNSAKKLREMVAEEYSQALTGDLQVDLLTVSLDAFKADSPSTWPEGQMRLAELAKQVRELG